MYSKELDADTAFRLLANRDRRRLLFDLYERGQRAPGVPLDGNSLGDTYGISLLHVHLPSLEDAGVITWDKTTNEVAWGPAFDTLRPLLALFEENQMRLPNGWR